MELTSNSNALATNRVIIFGANLPLCQNCNNVRILLKLEPGEYLYVRLKLKPAKSLKPNLGCSVRW